jgi:hypothetical protein
VDVVYSHGVLFVLTGGDPGTNSRAPGVLTCGTVRNGSDGASLLNGPGPLSQLELVSSSLPQYGDAHASDLTTPWFQHKAIVCTIEAPVPDDAATRHAGAVPLHAAY